MEVVCCTMEAADRYSSTVKDTAVKLASSEEILGTRIKKEKKYVRIRTS